MITCVFTDGGVVLKNPSPIGGTWAFVFVNEHNQCVLQQSGFMASWEGHPATNNQSEFMAIAHALLALPTGWSGVLYSDSQVSIGRFSQSWSLKGGLSDAMRQKGAEALHHVGHVEYVLLDGHPTKMELMCSIGKRGHPVSEWNVLCDKMCGVVARNELMKARAIHGENLEGMKQ